MQVYIRYEAYHNKNANTSKLKEAACVYVLQLKADHRGSRFPPTEFQWLGPYIIEKVLPNNKNLRPKIGTNKTQVLQHMRMRQFTQSQPPRDIRTTPKECRHDPEVSPKGDDLYARAWACE